MDESSCLLPNINDGRFFVSPILGCAGACSYCYLKIKDFKTPRKNKITESKLFSIAKNSPDFIFGKNGTIVSVGAWGDIFPINNNALVSHSVRIIKYLLSWGNPTQIMSKYFLCDDYVKEIARAIKYPGQLLYSTTITTIESWRSIEPGTSDPIERLKTCYSFHNLGIPTNVLLKPFVPGITDVSIEKIADLLLEYHIDYCTLGVLYYDSKIAKKFSTDQFLKEKLNLGDFMIPNHLDCNGEILIDSTSSEDLVPYVDYLRKRGVLAYLKSSCVNSNILKVVNPGDYYKNNNRYCINCGNCKSISADDYTSNY